MRQPTPALGRPGANRRRGGRRPTTGPTSKATTGIRHPDTKIRQGAGEEASLVGRNITVATSPYTPHRRRHHRATGDPPADRHPALADRRTPKKGPANGTNTAAAISRTYRPSTRQSRNYTRSDRGNTAFRSARRATISGANSHRDVELPVHRRRPAPVPSIPAMADRRRATTAG